MLNIEVFPVFLRFLFGGSAVVISTLAAKNFGGRLGGIFAGLSSEEPLLLPALSCCR